MQDTLLTRQLDRPADARAWLAGAVDYFGLGFHWDTTGFDYVDTAGRPVFDTSAAERFDRQSDRAYILLVENGADPYGLALELMSEVRNS